MENIKTRNSILKQFFSLWKEMFIDVGDSSNNIPTMTDLKAEDWELVSDADRKEILIKSPDRIREIFSKLWTKALPKKRKTENDNEEIVCDNKNIKYKLMRQFHSSTIPNGVKVGDTGNESKDEELEKQ